MWLLFSEFSGRMHKNLLDLLRSSSKLSVQKHPPLLQIITVCVWLFGCARLGKVAVAPATSAWKPLKEKASRRKNNSGGSLRSVQHQRSVFCYRKNFTRQNRDRHTTMWFKNVAKKTRNLLIAVILYYYNS